MKEGEYYLLKIDNEVVAIIQIAKILSKEIADIKLIYAIDMWSEDRLFHHRISSEELERLWTKCSKIQLALYTGIKQ